MEHFEYTLKPSANDRGILRKKIGLWVLYFCVAAIPAALTYLFIPVPIWPLMIVVIAAALAATVVFTWYRTHPEFEYSLDEGVLTVSLIHSGRTRKTVFELPLREALLIAPKDGRYSQKIDEFAPEVSYRAVFDDEQANYFVLFTDEDDTKAVLYINADLEAAKRFRRVCGRTVLSSNDNG